MYEWNKKQSPVLGLLGSGGGLGYLAGGAAAKTYVDDVFSTYLYEGNGGTQSINNGIDLAGKGGLVWFKKRSGTTYGGLWDTVRGVTKRLRPDNADAGSDASNLVTAFNSNGVSISVTGGTQINNNNDDYVSWTFRKQKGFFDVVTYTGNDTAGRAVAHNLGSVPGMIVIKCTSAQEDWVVYHRSIGATKNLRLNADDSERTETNKFNDTEPTSTNFTLGSNNLVNGSGRTYVAYVFAHNDAQFGTDDDESIVHCGTYNGTGSPFDIDIGFEAQWVMYKKTTGSDNWYIIDNMRGLTAQGRDSRSLKSNLTDAENGSGNYPAPYAKGFRVITGNQNASGQSYIYMAIRRPNKPPESGTDVFHSYYGTPASNSTITTGFPFSMQIAKEASSANAHRLFTRKLGLNTWDTTSNETISLQPAGSDEGQLGNLTRSVGNTSFGMASAYANNLMIFHSFKSAPGFMDVVPYVGNGSNGRTMNHNLGVVPEMMWIKRWDSSASNNWQVYFASQGNSKYSPSFRTDPFYSTSKWGNTTPTSTQFTISSDSDVNRNTSYYVNFLFATLPGISKIGTYSGTGSAINVDCGFTAGARFVMIKRTDIETQGNTPDRTDWYVWDYARGIVSGNDPFYQLSRNWAQTTNTDYIDPLNAGFTVNTSGGGINVSGGTYVFFAIA